MDVILPISIFGPISHFYLLRNKECCFETEETFQKRTVRNRIHILGPNGKQTLTIPLKKGKNQSRITETLISYDEDWVRNHLYSIKTAYGNTPYFEHYFFQIEDILNIRPTQLFDLYKIAFQFMSTILNLNEVSYTNAFYKKYSEDILDLRYSTLGVTIFNRPYFQAFESKFGFVENLSILDLLFNLGPEASSFLKSNK